MRTFLSLEEAWEETLSQAQAMATEEVELLEAYGRILSEPITARLPFPSFDRSMLDGYAVRAQDIAHATPESPVLLRVLEEVGAGQVPRCAVGLGEAIRIMTGAPIPAGADAIVRLEATERVEEGQVRIRLSFRAGEAISRQGEDAAVGSLLVEAGREIGAAELAVLATNGCTHIPVHRRPRVGVIVSGAEVRPVGSELAPGQLYDSNGPMLMALIRDQGGVPILYGQVGDDLDALAARIQEAAAECDLLLTTGGVSVGDYDLMREAYGQAGGEVLFWKVSMRPGTPITYGRVGRTPVFGLSGNPAAAFVNAVLLVQPVLRKLAGQRVPEHRPVQAVLDSQYESRVIGLDRFLRARLSHREGQLIAEVPSHGQKTGILSTLIQTEGLVRIPGGTEVASGQVVDVFLLHPGGGRR